MYSGIAQIDTSLTTRCGVAVYGVILVPRASFSPSPSHFFIRRDNLPNGEAFPPKLDEVSVEGGITAGVSKPALVLTPNVVVFEDPKSGADESMVVQLLEAPHKDVNVELDAEVLVTPKA